VTCLMVAEFSYPKAPLEDPHKRQEGDAVPLVQNRFFFSKKEEMREQ
jgi:hypothetical protein